MNNFIAATLCPKDDEFELPDFNETDPTPPPVQGSQTKVGTYIGSAIGFAVVILVVIYGIFKWCMWYQ